MGGCEDRGCIRDVAGRPDNRHCWTKPGLTRRCKNDWLNKTIDFDRIGSVRCWNRFGKAQLRVRLGQPAAPPLADAAWVFHVPKINGSNAAMRHHTRKSQENGTSPQAEPARPALEGGVRTATCRAHRKRPLREKWILSWAADVGPAVGCPCEPAMRHGKAGPRSVEPATGHQELRLSTMSPIEGTTVDHYNRCFYKRYNKCCISAR